MKAIILIAVVSCFQFDYLMYEQHHYCNVDGRCFDRADRITSIDTDLIMKLRKLFIK